MMPEYVSPLSIGLMPGGWIPSTQALYSLQYTPWSLAITDYSQPFYSPPHRPIFNLCVLFFTSLSYYQLRLPLLNFPILSSTSLSILSSTYRSVIFSTSFSYFLPFILISTSSSFPF